MARIAGVDIPQNKRGEISLTYIYGIGRNISRDILIKADVDVNKKVQDWKDEEIQKIGFAEGFLALKNTSSVNPKRTPKSMRKK